MWTSEEFHTLETIDEKIKLLESFITNLLSIDLWEISHSENTRRKTKLLKGSHRKYTKCGPLEIFHTSKILMKDPNFLKCSIGNLLRCGPLKNSTLSRITMKDQNSQKFHRNILSVKLWKDSTLMKTSIKVRTSQKFHRVWIEVWTSVKFHS